MSSVGKEEQSRCTTAAAHIPDLRSFSFVVDKIALFALLSGKHGRQSFFHVPTGMGWMGSASNRQIVRCSLCVSWDD